MTRLTALLAIVAAHLPHPHAHAAGHHHRRWHHALASVYGNGDGQLGGPLACGGHYTRGLLGVANRHLRCHSHVRLCHTSRCVTARVLDRGPYVGGRDFDLMLRTRAALRCSDLCHVRWAVR